jgi:hypothetical protein
MDSAGFWVESFPIGDLSSLEVLLKCKEVNRARWNSTLIELTDQLWRAMICGNKSPRVEGWTFDSVRFGRKIGGESES